jgi:hypothetical protein
MNMYIYSMYILRYVFKISIHVFRLFIYISPNICTVGIFIFEVRRKLIFSPSIVHTIS